MSATTPAGQPSPPPAPKVRDWNLARELHRSGATWQQIQDQAGIPSETVRKTAYQEKWLRTRDAVLVIRREDSPGTSIHPQEMAGKSDRLRGLLVDTTMAAVERVIRMGRPNGMKAERERADLTRTLTAQAEIVCGWSRQDQAAGAIVVGYASQVLGTRTAPKGPGET